MGNTISRPSLIVGVRQFCGVQARYKCPKFISREVRDLIGRILNTDPKRRVDIAAVRAHAWMASGGQRPQKQPSGGGSTSSSSSGQHARLLFNCRIPTINYNPTYS